MREIKFRAWNKEEKEMFTFTFINLEGNLLMLGLPYSTRSWKLYDDSCVVQQYTGRKDKNGKDIYELDIINDGENIGYVDYVEETTEYIVDYWRIGDKNSKGEQLSLLDNIEVIGNVFENKDLLK